MERRPSHLSIIEGGKKPIPLHLPRVLHEALPVYDELRDLTAAIRRFDHNERVLQSSAWQSAVDTARRNRLGSIHRTPTPIERGHELRALRQEK